ncbi:MAG: hypothetical protein B0D92_00905 [Spirochaeta sp. LUC14_002_19_P3]|nr:MAG: hypothetical protein B0D92_00905 [Spirochaeta sp. LUC14_002_19_P3]
MLLPSCSTSGVKTIIEVGYNPKLKDEIDQLNEELKKITQLRSKIHLNIQGIIRQVRLKKIKFSKEKKKLFGNMQVQFNQITKRVNEIESEIKTRQEDQDSLVANGRMSASCKVLAGVILRIRDVEYVVRESYDRAVTFLLDGTYIRTDKYREITEDITRS